MGCKIINVVQCAHFTIYNYFRSALIDFIGFEPRKYCDMTTSVHIAKAAYVRSLKLANIEGERIQSIAGNPYVGIGCTASLVSSRPKRGLHQAFVSALSLSLSLCLSVSLSLSVSLYLVCIVSSSSTFR